MNFKLIWIRHYVTVKIRLRIRIEDWNGVELGLCVASVSDDSLLVALIVRQSLLF